MSHLKTALFGGTFDPIHNGHIAVARSASELIGADKLIFIPAKRSALKADSPFAPDADRMQMIRLATCGIEKFEVTDFELQRPAPSFTIDTVRHFKKKLGSDAELYWLIGTDSVSELDRWHKIKELIDQCNIACMYRAGYELPDFSVFADKLGDARVDKLQSNILATPLVDISSTQIRARLKKGLDVSDMLNPRVAEYIKSKGLYR